MKKEKNSIWIIDLGSQYSQLITRKTRELSYSAMLITYDEFQELWDKNERPKALILSGGPRSVFEDQTNYSILNSEEIKSIPTLGVCYGMQLIIYLQNNELVKRGKRGEYGDTKIIDNEGKYQTVWMSHFDEVISVPSTFEVLYKTENNVLAGIKHKENPWMALQFHPEVSHTENGKMILESFLKDVAKLEKDFHPEDILNYTVAKFREEDFKMVEEEGGEILCAFSGGVDSLVAATLIEEKMGKTPYCFFIDNGLVREQDYRHLEKLKVTTNLKIEIIDAKNIFYQNLKGVTEPEQKRKIIGKTFIDVFEKTVKEYKISHNINFKYLLQGTLYPDIIESRGHHKKGGASHTIKSHHNVGGLPEKMNLKVIEPLKWLFKDEVRKLGIVLNLKKEDVYRHPFPGPGLGVRILGEVTEDRCDRLRIADDILFQELVSNNFYNKTWQAFVVLLPIKTVGVKGDTRAYEEVLTIRMVDSEDGMTAGFTELPFSFFRKVSGKMTSEVPGITRVTYDITSKPPGTIEWE